MGVSILSRINKRRLIAFFVSLLMPIGGYFILGRFRRGIVLFPIALSFILLAPFYIYIFLVAILFWVLILLDILLLSKTYKPPFSKILLGLIGLVLIGGLLSSVLRESWGETFQIPTESMIPSLQVGDYLYASKMHYQLSIPFTSKELVHFGEPKHGDIVIFTKPGENQSIQYIYRVVAVGGDTISMQNRVLTVNGETASLSPQNIKKNSPSSVSGNAQHQMALFEEELSGVKYQVQYDETPSYSCSLSKETRCWSHVGMRCQWPKELCVSEKDENKPITIPEGHVFVMGDNRDNAADSRLFGPIPLSSIQGKALYLWYSSDSFLSPRWNRIFLSLE